MELQTNQIGGSVRRKGTRKAIVAEAVSYPYTPIYLLENSDEIVGEESHAIMSEISDVVSNKTGFGHMFDGVEKKTKSYFKDMLRNVPSPVLAVLNQHRSRDPKTVGDMYGVAPLGYRFGVASGIEGNDLFDLCLGLLLHDIGKDGLIPVKDLHRDGPLTEEEWRLMLTHPERGADTLDMLNNHLRRNSQETLREKVKKVLFEHHLYDQYKQVPGKRVRHYPEVAPDYKPCIEARLAKLADGLHTGIMRIGTHLETVLADARDRAMGTEYGIEYRPEHVNLAIALAGIPAGMLPKNRMLNR